VNGSDSGRGDDGPPVGVRLRNLQSPAEIGVDKNTTVVFRAPLMTTIAGLGSFLAREAAASGPASPPGRCRPDSGRDGQGAPESSWERGEA